MRQSPIYSTIQNKNKGNTSFGSEGFIQDIKVGTSSKNSYHFANIRVERITEPDKISFELWLDGHLIRICELKGKEFTLTRDINIRIGE